MFINITFILNYNHVKSLSLNNMDQDAKISLTSFHGIILKRTLVTQYTSLILNLSSHFFKFLKIRRPNSNDIPIKDHNNYLSYSTTNKLRNEQSSDNITTASTYILKDHRDNNEDKIKVENKNEKDEKSFKENEAKDLEITKNATNVLNDLEKKILVKEHKIKPEDKKLIKKKKRKENKRKHKTTTKPMENPNLFQGDIILTNDQAKKLVKAQIKRAKKRKIRVPKYKSKLRFMRE
uniref:Ribosome biogenesis protein NOP53 n=1 Tax=Strongyloides venezuelensis TaxID=75913 RepID=A0A0K0FQJ9_STRVS